MFTYGVSRTQSYAYVNGRLHQGDKGVYWKQYIEKSTKDIAGSSTLHFQYYKQLKSVLKKNILHLFCDFAQFSVI